MVKLSIIIPAYNEENTIIELLNKVDAVDLQVEKVIVVEDCSTDKTLSLLNKNKKLYININLKLIEVKVCAEVGLLLRLVTTFYFKMQIEYDPNDYKKLIEPILRFNADVVIGSRLWLLNTRVYYFWHKLGNKFITLVFNLLNNTTLLIFFVVTYFLNRFNSTR